MPLFRDGKVKEDRIAQTVYIKALRDSNRQRWCLVEVFDISKAVKRETTLKQQQRVLEELIQEVNEKAGQLSLMNEQQAAFFQNISHELRTPLTLIMTPLDMAIQRAESSSQVKLDFLETERMSRNSRRLMRLITSFWMSPRSKPA